MLTLRLRQLRQLMGGLITLVALAVCAIPGGIAAEKIAMPPKQNLQPQLAGFAPFLGKTYRAEIASDAGQPVVDISRWERALNGTAIRILHSINQGEYGGESLIFYDQQTQDLRFYYFTTAGFYTQGRVHFDGNQFVSTEQVNGNQDGITHVTSTATLQPDGSFIMESVYMKGPTPASSSRAHYRPVTDQQPQFK